MRTFRNFRNLSENTVDETLKDLYKQIDDLFEKIKDNLFTMVEPRAGIIDKVKNWWKTRFTGFSRGNPKHPEFRQRDIPYATESLKPSLNEYHQFNCFVENFTEELNEARGTITFQHVEDMLDRYKSTLKSLVGQYVSRVNIPVNKPTPDPVKKPFFGDYKSFPSQTKPEDPFQRFSTTTTGASGDFSYPAPDPSTVRMFSPDTMKPSGVDTSVSTPPPTVKQPEPQEPKQPEPPTVKQPEAPTVKQPEPQEPKQPEAPTVKQPEPETPKAPQEPEVEKEPSEEDLIYYGIAAEVISGTVFDWDEVLDAVRQSYKEEIKTYDKETRDKYIADGRAKWEELKAFKNKPTPEDISDEELARIEGEKSAKKPTVGGKGPGRHRLEPVNIDDSILQKFGKALPGEAEKITAAKRLFVLAERPGRLKAFFEELLNKAEEGSGEKELIESLYKKITKKTNKDTKADIIIKFLKEYKPGLPDSVNIAMEKTEGLRMGGLQKEHYHYLLKQDNRPRMIFYEAIKLPISERIKFYKNHLR